MEREAIFERLNQVFREVFDDETLTVNDDTTAADIDGWDSLIHITLISAVEEAFGVTFNMRDVVRMQNVGDMADLLEAEL